VGQIATQLADAAEADALHRQAHDISTALGYRNGQAEALEGLAAAAHGRGEPETAQQHLQQAEEIRRQIGSS